MISENGHNVETGKQPRVARREMRATAARPRQLCARRAPVVTRDSGLAQALLARYLARAWLWGRLGLIFHRQQPGPIVQHVARRVWINLAPRLQLTLVHNEAASPEATAVALSAPAWLLNRPAQSSALTQIVRRLHRREQVELSVRMQTTQRLLKRSARVKAVAAPGSQPAPRTHISTPRALPSPGAPDPITRAARPVQRVVRRATNGRADAQDGRPNPAARPDVHPEASFAASGRSPVAAPVAPAVDITRVTEQVMQQIDRRILAHRERTGRI